jgi:hypothetical protein
LARSFAASPRCAFVFLSLLDWLSRQGSHLFPDVTHEKNGPVFSEKGSGPGLGDRNREAEAALGLVPELAIAVETKPHPLVVYDHFFQSAHERPPGFMNGGFIE